MSPDGLISDGLILGRMDILDIIWTVVILALVVAPELLGKTSGKKKHTSGENMPVPPIVFNDSDFGLDDEESGLDDGKEEEAFGGATEIHEEMPSVQEYPFPAGTPAAVELPAPASVDTASHLPVKTDAASSLEDKTEAAHSLADRANTTSSFVSEANAARAVKSIRRADASDAAQQEGSRQGRKIDPKQLIVYSAIMQPKFEEV